MNVIERTASLALDLLPSKEVRQVLLPPVRALREVAVSVAATVRHWELALGGDYDIPERAGEQKVTLEPDFPVTEQTAAALVDVGDEVWDDIGGAPVTFTDEGLAVHVPDVTGSGPTIVDVRDLPVEEWPQLSLADAQARLNDVDAQGLRSLIAYETHHGHRLQYTMMLEQRLSALTAASDG
jgi:hypothetical protein